MSFSLLMALLLLCVAIMHLVVPSPYPGLCNPFWGVYLCGCDRMTVFFFLVPTSQGSRQLSSFQLWSCNFAFVTSSWAPFPDKIFSMWCCNLPEISTIFIVSRCPMSFQWFGFYGCDPTLTVDLLDQRWRSFHCHSMCCFYDQQWDLWWLFGGPWVLIGPCCM